ncbi:MAG: cytochrome c [Flavobacteriales bacterium]|jgi:mono/diheme cytochrome c family protein|nr:cytochrome c [Flavobacteriales bacterium]NCG30923.1 c-type cytochrome [Bacteroidota bacterium]MBT3962760.1 cytochrome c [Flavobacteriales bacterium]MBT4704575.1 cytochrome c [Flavobacteriales bacterium]MBT4929557.1 cytochrome c [Flavobacteriales bacterium]
MKKTALSFLSKLGVVALSFYLVSCSPNPQSPGIEYMPDMYRTQALEPYSGNTNYADSMEARKPAEGSIARGYLPYGLPNTNEGYAKAGELLTNPYPNSEEVITEGKVIYSKMCVHCHGKEGAGDGPTVAAGHPPPPAYNSAALARLVEGKMFHSITYGKNLMGPHSSQLNVEERWKVIRYVQTLQNPDGEGEAKESTDEVEPMAEDAPADGNVEAASEEAEPEMTN